MTLRAQLVPVERRWRLVANRHRGLAAAAAVVAAGLLAGAWRLTGLSSHLVAPPSTVASAMLIAVAAVATWLLLGWRQRRRRPDVSELAQVVDHRYGLRHLVTTAVEVEARAETTLVARALLEEASLRAALVNPHDVVPWRAPGWTWLLPLGIVVATLAMIVPVGREVPPATLGSAERTPPQAEDLARVAELLQTDAAVSSDAYVQAVARSLEQLSTQIAAGAITAEEADEALAALLDQLSRALAPLDPHLAAAISGALGDRLAAPGEAPSAELRLPFDVRLPADPTAAEGTAPPSMLATGGPQTGEVRGARSEASSALSATLQELERRAAAAAPPAGAGDGGDAATLDSFTPSYLDANAQATFRRNAPSDAAEAVGAPVAAADQSTDRAGDGAGDGTASVEAGAAGTDIEGFALVEERVELPWNERAEGRRTTVELVPETVFTPLIAPTTANDSFERQVEAGAAHETVDPLYRAVVSRYFTPVTVAAPPDRR